MTDVFADLQRQHFSCITADPPWVFRAFGALQTQNPGSRRDVERHYSTMRPVDIASMPVSALAAKDAHLFMWITGPCLVEGQHIQIMRAWGFKPVAMAFVWIKSKKSLSNQSCAFIDEHAFVKGLGHTTRQNAEYVILGRRGSPKRLTKAMHQIIVQPRREHSRKPDEFFVRVEEYCDGPRLELFSRQRRPGWTSFGNEVDRFQEAAE